MKSDPGASEPFSAAHPLRVGCQECGLFQFCRTPFLRPWVPKGWHGGRRVLAVGEGPGEDEDERTHRPFTGPAGQLLVNLLREAGYRREDVAFDNSVRCRPKGNATPVMGQIRACRPFLLRVIEVLRPALVIGLGATALRALTNDGSRQNVTRERGRLLTCPGITDRPPLQDGPQRADVGSGSDFVPRVFSTYHPAAVLRGATALRALILEDLCHDWDQVPDLVVGMPRGSSLGIDTEYASDGELLTVAFSDGTRAVAFDVEDTGWRHSVVSLLTRSRKLTGHSIANDLLVLRGAGFPIASAWLRGRNVADSLLSRRLENENRLSYELENLATSLLGATEWKSASNQVIRAEGAQCLSSDARKDRCRRDAWASIRLCPSSTDVPPRAIGFAHEIDALFARVELTGAMIDTQRYRDLREEIGRELFVSEDRLQKIARAAGMTEFSPTNDGHLRDLLYNRLHLPILDRTAKAKLPSVGKGVLTQLDAPAATILLEYNRLQKLASTNLDGLEKFLVHTHPTRAFLPTHFDSLGARTGRRSSKSPNFQNWPASMRSMVVSRYPGGMIGRFDYSRLEVILLAWLAGDERLLETFTTGQGYVQVGKDLLHRAVVEGSREYKLLKSLVLGTDYNMGDERFARELWVTHQIQLSSDWRTHFRRAAELKRKYLTMYPGLGRYMDAREDELLQTGQIVAPDGVIRHLPCPDGRRTPGYGHLLNQAINYPIQHSASVVTGCALLGIETALLDDAGLDLGEYCDLLLASQRKYLTSGMGRDIIPPEYEPLSVVFNEVHDEIVVDFHPDGVERDAERVQELMKAPPRLVRALPGFNVPLAVHVQRGPSWGEGR